MVGGDRIKGGMGVGMAASGASGCCLVLACLRACMLSLYEWRWPHRITHRPKPMPPPTHTHAPPHTTPPHPTPPPPHPNTTPPTPPPAPPRRPPQDKEEFGEHLRNFRRALVARPGWLLLAADYSQVELRVIAHITQVGLHS